MQDDKQSPALRVNVCGLDECGRGALAGPLVAAGVILWHGKNHRNKQTTKELTTQLRDSKKLSARQRNTLFEEIVESGALIEIEIISTRQINNVGIGWANKEIFRRLIKRIRAYEYVVDGNLNLGRIKNKSKNVKSLVNADATIEEVMAASIVAKVTRDRLMEELHLSFPSYGWNINKGYGTKSHLDKLAENGACNYHRGIFVTTALRNRMAKERSLLLRSV